MCMPSIYVAMATQSAVVRDRFVPFLEILRLLEQIPRTAPIFILGHSRRAGFTHYLPATHVAGLILSNPYLGLALEVPAPKLVAAASSASSYQPPPYPRIDPSGRS